MESNQVIPDEAVEAAWDKLHENPIRPIGIDWAELAAAIEAAAPHLLAPVLALHAPTDWKPGNPRPADSDRLCANCWTAYPCATVEAATGIANV